MINNILVTAIGSHSAHEVIRSLKRLRADKSVKIFGCDIYPKEWHHITKEFDKIFLAPQVSQELDYKDFIFELIKKYSIRTIIPLTDIEVDFFNKNRQLFEGILITIGHNFFLQISRDKYLLSKFLEKHNFPFIQTYTPENIETGTFPLIAKPRNGRSSEGVHVVYNINQFKSLPTYYDNYVFQEIIKGDVCTVDAVKDRYGNITVVTRKELIRSNNGAGLTVEMFSEPKLNQISKSILEKLEFTGCANLEFIKTNTSYYLIDINPRYSAGIGFTALYGYDIVKNSLLAYNEKEIEPFNKNNKIIFQKILSEVINYEE